MHVRPRVCYGTFMGRAQGKVSDKAGHTAISARRRGLAVSEPTVSVSEPTVPSFINTANIRERGPTACMSTGVVTVVRSQKEFDDTIRRWTKLGPQVLAHDLECAASPTVPNGSGLHPHLGTIRLAQFGVRDGGKGYPEALVIDCWKFKADKAVALLEDPKWPTIIHYAQMETKWIGYKYGARIENLIDTREASKLIYERHGFVGEPLAEDIERLSQDQKNIEAAEEEAIINETKPKKPRTQGIRHALGVVSQRELGIDLSKENQNSAWDAVKLTKEQQKYAGEDVLVLLDLWERFEPLLTYEDRESIEKSARYLNDQSAGISENDAHERNLLALAERGINIRNLPGGVLSAHHQQLLFDAKELTFATTPDAKGCESVRARRMISACKDERDLEKMKVALPYMRIHFSNRDDVEIAIKKRARQIKNGSKSKRQPKIKAAGWTQPF